MDGSKAFFENRLLEYEKAGFPHLKTQVVTAITLLSREGPEGIDFEQLRVIWDRAEEEYTTLCAAAANSTVHRHPKKRKIKIKKRIQEESSSPRPLAVVVPRVQYIDENKTLIWDDPDHSLKDAMHEIVGVFFERVLRACAMVMTDGEIALEHGPNQNKAALQFLMPRGRAEQNTKMELAARELDLKLRRTLKPPKTTIDLDTEALRLAQERSNTFALSLANNNGAARSAAPKQTKTSIPIIKDTRGQIQDDRIVIDNVNLLKAFRYAEVHSPIYYKIPITPWVRKHLMYLQILGNVKK